MSIMDNENLKQFFIDKLIYISLNTVLPKCYEKMYKNKTVL